MTGARPYEDQGALFGDLDGLFATIDTMPVTPIGEVRLIPTQGGMFTQPEPVARCPAYSVGFGERAQCTKLSGHRTEADPHVYGRKIDLAADEYPDHNIPWRVACTWGDHLDRTAPTSPDGHCFAYIENRDDREDNGHFHDSEPLPADQQGSYDFRGACSCGWRGPAIYEHGEREAYNDAADHAHPGWRDLPVLPDQSYEPTKAQRARHDTAITALIPADWTGPVRHNFGAHGSACHKTPCRGVVPGRGPDGRVDLCACPCHISADDSAWHDAYPPAERVTATATALF